jgi:predicted transcriptional regulator
MTGQSPDSVRSLDRFLDALANKYRRRLLLALLEHNPQSDEDPQIPDDVAITDEDLDDLMMQMPHVHLPKLEEAGLIEWDRDTNAVRKGTNFDEIRPLLELIRDHADELPDEWI